MEKNWIQNDTCVLRYIKNDWQTRVFSRKDEVFESVVTVAFQNVFRSEMNQNNFFYF